MIISSNSLWKTILLSITLLVVVLSSGLVSANYGLPYPIDNLPTEKSTQAFVTILDDDTFLSAVRVVCKSVRETRSTHPFIAIVTDRVSERSKKVLKEDKIIIIHEIPTAKGKIYPYMYLWYLEKYGYTNIIFLSTDVLVKRNIDSLFNCKGKVCGTNSMTIPDDLDTFFMAIKPSIATFEDMVAREEEILKKAYDRNAQAFLNTYYNWRLAEYADDQMIENGSTKSDGLVRLPVHWNGFEPLYYTYRPSWDYMVGQGMRIINYNLYVKPWDWYSFPFLDLGQHWVACFHRLPVQSITPDFTPFFLLILPIIVAAVCFNFIGRQSFFNKSALYDYTCGFCGNVLRKTIFMNMNTPSKLRGIGYISCVLMFLTSVITILFFNAIQSNEWDIILRWTICYSWVASIVSMVLLFYYKFIIAETTLDLSNKQVSGTAVEMLSEEESDDDAVDLESQEPKKKVKKEQKPFISKSSTEEHPLARVTRYRPKLFWVKVLLILVFAPIAFIFCNWALQLSGSTDLGARAAITAIFLVPYVVFLLRTVYTVPIVAVFRVYERKYGSTLTITQNEEEFKGTKYN